MNRSIVAASSRAIRRRSTASKFSLSTALLGAALVCASATAASADPIGDLFGGLFGQRPVRQAAVPYQPYQSQAALPYQPYQSQAALPYYEPGTSTAYAYAPQETGRSPIPREMVYFDGSYAPGTVVISTSERRLYLVMPGNRALKYGIGVGREGFTWSGTQTISRKQEWPDWTPPAEMLRRRPDLPRHMEGGIDNPLGARAMYLGGSLYRIHGSNEPETIGTAVSSGCIRMTNEDVTDLYGRVKVGTRVVVLR